MLLDFPNRRDGTPNICYLIFEKSAVKRETATKNLKNRLVTAQPKGQPQHGKCTDNTNCNPQQYSHSRTPRASLKNTPKDKEKERRSIEKSNLLGIQTKTKRNGRTRNSSGQEEMNGPQCESETKAVVLKMAVIDKN
jgi:hypothetical protein